MRDERDVFFNALFHRCGQRDESCITLTAIHPDGSHPHPSRHVRAADKAALRDALTDLDAANRQGWGAFAAIGLRRPGLSRWQRGCEHDLVALPAVFVDIDDRSPDALARLRGFSLPPSCIVHSGGGFHAYWWLEEPTRELDQARRVLQALAACLGGDHTSVAQSLRIVGSVNTKPARKGALCRLVHLDDRRYPLNAFPLPHDTVTDRIRQVADILSLQGFTRRGDWLNGPCPNAERHKHGDRHPSFGFNTRTGYGFCHVCGSMLLKDLCAVLGVDHVTYRQIYFNR
ncbi:MAG: hypothetical protein IT298_17360 [Chloroflexi bacterium]|nr:hypothetical protein [Chloroflexota bacterium]